MNNKNSGFRMETLVHTKQGLKPIQYIRSGDLVLSNPDNQPPPNHARQEQEYIYRKVTKTLVTDDQPISKMVVVDLVNGKKEDILVTPNQALCRFVWNLTNCAKCSDWLWVPELTSDHDTEILIRMNATDKVSQGLSPQHVDSTSLFPLSAMI